ncbi:hypothetical protein DC429_06265 [Arthrobacter sp. TPD3018]|uniref:hypothetical protein n=1 Tax=Bacteria TaxID=2 RepID=UPI000D518CD4|nr:MULTISPECIES: hypothetical protein [Bacteria]PVE59966.1 hypothetical protein DC425_06255 [Sphingomonas sp. TPD3009]PVE61482.1 hypothetical protein DC429_06265 [Arthrobacter sp. TPD3018]PVE85601.1 hypothetical protein DC431_06920 [Sphingomonas melonis]
MRTLPALAAVALLAGCGSRPEASSDAATSGARLEAAAIRTGLIDDPTRADLVGSWALDTDRVCVVAGAEGLLRLGALVDYGEGQGCAASGPAQRSGDRVRVAFGTCRFEARFEGDRIVFPAELPASCDSLCTGRASLAALTVERLSTSTAEAETLRTPGGKLLCVPASPN